MKLNNKGFSVGTLFWLMSILCIALLYVVINSYQISQIYSEYNHKDDPYEEEVLNDSTVNVPITYYKSHEQRLINYATNYVEIFYNGEPFVKTTISKEMLKDSGLVTDIKDPVNNSSCNYYVIVSGNVYEPHLECSSYQTEVD